MDPKDFIEFKIFEYGLTKSPTNTPCADKQYFTYDRTDTHEFGPVKKAIDFYKHWLQPSEFKQKIKYYYKNRMHI